MKVLPIIMSAPMVLALLREIAAPGTGKTMTRRLAQVMRKNNFRTDYPPVEVPSIWCSVQRGDRIYIRESHWVFGRWASKKESGKVRVRFVRERGHGVLFAADTDMRIYEKGRFGQKEPAWHLRPSIFLPRAESRLTLIVSDGWREHLKEITDAECIAEGAEVLSSGPDGSPMTYIEPKRNSYERQTVRAWYHRLWDSLHGENAWEENPEVVAISFKPVLQNVETMKEAA